ncbi:hypothetical protein RFI_12778 [Reticulomyxa filosa]|uniref:Uncharacterized protein n=1 Tax=Reticulomyxa filosa TaxID=46433 RepID=X6NES8_RETFI|nr:hypothetical protein RFI_12778 [Reticulomyxa filosa]|eukprot:ETO24378.1 hypothetical protein RFI_12778 [Reticulomyxa filosa]
MHFENYQIKNEKFLNLISILNKAAIANTTTCQFLCALILYRVSASKERKRDDWTKKKMDAPISDIMITHDSTLAGKKYKYTHKNKTFFQGSFSVVFCANDRRAAVGGHRILTEEKKNKQRNKIKKGQNPPKPRKTCMRMDEKWYDMMNGILNIADLITDLYVLIELKKSGRNDDNVINTSSQWCGICVEIWPRKAYIDSTYVFSTDHSIFLDGAILDIFCK